MLVRCWPRARFSVPRLRLLTKTTRRKLIVHSTRCSCRGRSSSCWAAEATRRRRKREATCALPINDHRSTLFLFLYFCCSEIFGSCVLVVAHRLAASSCAIAKFAFVCVCVWIFGLVAFGLSSVDRRVCKMLSLRCSIAALVKNSRAHSLTCTDNDDLV